MRDFKDTHCKIVVRFFRDNDSQLSVMYNFMLPDIPVKRLENDAFLFPQ